MIKNLLREGLVNLYEGKVKATLTEGPIALFEIIKGYYEMTGDHQIDGHNINELYVYLKEEEDLTRLDMEYNLVVKQK
jgi:hypothetical protein